MIVSLLLDHYTIKTARRALLVASVIAILIPSLTITGSGLIFFGVTLELRQETILGSARLISLYFLWTFLWLNFASATKAMGMKVSEMIKGRIEYHRQAASDVEMDPNHQNGWEPDIEPWWQHFYETETRLQKRDLFAASLVQAMGVLAVICVEYLPPLLIGGLAVFAPYYANEVIFSLFH